MIYVKKKNELMHFGIKGQKWGVRNYQNPDGTLTEEGRARYRFDASTDLDKKGNLNKTGKEKFKHLQKEDERTWGNNDENSRNNEYEAQSYANSLLLNKTRNNKTLQKRKAELNSLDGESDEYNQKWNKLFEDTRKYCEKVINKSLDEVPTKTRDVGYWYTQQFIWDVFFFDDGTASDWEHVD